MQERWHPINDGYEVSDHGRVRNRKTGRVLKPGKANKSGHLTVMLGRGDKRYVHHLVAVCFVSGRKPGLEVRHRDGNSGNNFWRNLHWSTRGRNTQDKKHHAGQKGRLKIEQIRAIKRELQNPYHGINQDLAARFGVSHVTISHIRTGYSHAEVR